MACPVSVEDGQVKVDPDSMQKEKIYHCIFKNKAILVFKDSQDLLNCYEIEDGDLVEKIRKYGKNSGIERLFEDHISEHNLKN